MATSSNKHVLWAGPEDGLEVEVQPGQQEFLIPPQIEVPLGPLIDRMPSKPGTYLWSKDKQRFEWQGYV